MKSNSEITLLPMCQSEIDHIDRIYEELLLDMSHTRHVVPNRIFDVELGFNSNIKISVAHKDSIIIGFISYGILLDWGSDYGFIYKLAVIPNYRRNGYARYMRTHALKDLHDQGCKIVCSGINHDNIPMINLSKSMGFTIWDYDDPIYEKYNILLM